MRNQLHEPRNQIQFRETDSGKRNQLHEKRKQIHKPRKQIYEHEAKCWNAKTRNLETYLPVTGAFCSSDISCIP